MNKDCTMTILEKYKKTIGWGTGICYKRFGQEYHDKLSFLIDSNPKLEGTCKDGMKIYAPVQLTQEIPEDCLIIVFAVAFDEISKMAFSYGEYDIIDAYLLDALRRNTGYCNETIKIQQEQLILSIAGFDAVYYQNGSNKFITHQNEILHAHGYDILQVTPLKNYLHKAQRMCFVEMKYNDVELGATSQEALFQQVREAGNMIIHSLYECYTMLDEIVRQIDIAGDILYYLHDYYCICENRFLYNPLTKVPCTDYEQITHCIHCDMYEKRVAINAFHQTFFENYHVKLIAPSQTVKDIVQKIYIENPIRVIPHLKYDIVENQPTSKHTKLRIGHIGTAAYIKGWNEFKRMANELRDEYEFYCLGACDETDRPDFMHYISISLKSSGGKMNMVEALNRHEIDIAFLGSVLKETYSYTYYEAYEAGAYVITMEGNGNISAQVLNNHNGQVFKTIEEMLRWLKHKESVMEAVKNLRNRITNVRIDNSFLEYITGENSERYKTSVVIPVYNTEKYIAECILSVFNQTQKDIEIIIVNDGSTDNSLNIVKDLTCGKENVRIVNQENKGPGAARNAGIDKANGEYIYFLDADDYIEPDLLESCYQCAHNNSLDVVFFDARSFKEEELNFKFDKNEFDRKSVIEDANRIYTGIDFLDLYMHKPHDNSSVCLMYASRKFMMRSNLRFMENVLHEDVEYHYAMMLKAQKIMYMPKILYNRRYRPNSIMTSISEKNIESIILIVEKMFCIDEQCGNKQSIVERDSILRLLIVMIGLCRGELLDISEHNRLQILSLIRQAAERVGTYCQFDEINYMISLYDEFGKIFPEYKEMTDEEMRIFQLRREAMLIDLLGELPLSNEESIVAIYGGGKHTKWFLNEYRKLIGAVKAKVVIIDSHKRSLSEKFQDYDIYNINDIEAVNISAIIVSSVLYEDEIYQKILDLYGNRYPIYRFYDRNTLCLFNIRD